MEEDSIQTLLLRAAIIWANYCAGRYSDPAALFIASTDSSTVNRGVVLTALEEPPAAKAMEIAPASTLLGI
jgi:hypothetical protein